MATDEAARRRASFARADRVKKEAAQETGQPPEERTAEQQQRNAVRLTRQRGEGTEKQASTKKATDRKTAEQKAAAVADQDAKREAATKAALKRVEDSHRATEKRRLQQRAESTKKEFGRKAEDQKATAAAAQEAKREAATKASLKRVEDNHRATEKHRLQHREESTKKEFNQKAADPKAAAAQARDDEIRKRAEVFVDARQKAQQADQVKAHRHQTDQLRTQHQAETQSHRNNATDAEADHTQRIKSIDSVERSNLDDLDTRRRSLAGRVTAIVKGPGHYSREEKAITERHEAERMRQHRNHEGQKERQFEAAQTARLRQARERLSIRTCHRFEVHDLKQSQDRNRPAEIERRQHAFARAAQMERGQVLEKGRSH